MMFRFLILTVALLLGHTQSSLAQTDREPTNTGSISVFSLKSKSRIAEVPIDSAYKIVRSEGNWPQVQFLTPSVPVWVSAEYVTQEVDQGDEIVTVIASRLNVRFAASTTSKILTSVKRGFQSKVLARQNGFVQIYAPTWVEFRLLSRDLNRMQSIDTAGEVAVDSSIKPKDGNLNSITSSWELPPFASSEKTPANKQAPAAPPTIRKPRSEKTTLAAQHSLSPGDTISLQVFGEKDLGVSNVRIPQSGEVSFPLIGSVLVAGKTVKDVEGVVGECTSRRVYQEPQTEYYNRCLSTYFH